MKYTSFGEVRQALNFAAVAHAKQTRKEKVYGIKLPYIVHPMGVSVYLRAAGARDKVIIAGILHDVLEDTKITEQEIADLFGQEVLDLVLSVTEPKEKSWQERKEHKIKSLCAGSLEVKMLGAADHCDNLLSILDALRQEGLKTPEEYATAVVWQNFHQPFEKQKWYHQQSCIAIFANLPPDKIPPFFGKLMRLVEQIFGEKIINDPEIRLRVRRRKHDWINPYSFEAPPKRLKAKK